LSTNRATNRRGTFAKSVLAASHSSLATAFIVNRETPSITAVRLTRPAVAN